MAKIEKTLELNITHEILSLADSFWWYLQPVSLKRYWRPHWRFPLMQPPKSFATGLHINIEGKKGGGYDVCINSPANFQGGKPRLLFIQFKAGVEKSFNSNSKSIFYGSASKPKVHVEFDINSNKKKNQHKLLQELASKAGNKDAVVYVFPRIVNNTQLEQNIGSLLRKTSFISIADINAKATKNGITIDDGNTHNFRTCYNNYDRNEINLLLLLLGKFEKPGGLLGEILCVRMYRALQSLKEVQQNEYLISRFHVMDAMLRHIMNIGRYFSIPYSKTIASLNDFSSVQKRLRYIEEYENLPQGYPDEKKASEHDNEIFDNIMQAMSIYFKWIESIKYFDKQVKIPPPPSNHTIELTDNSIRFGLNEEEGIAPEDFDDIYYQLI